MVGERLSKEGEARSFYYYCYQPSPPNRLREPRAKAPRGQLPLPPASVMTSRAEEVVEERA